LRIGIIWEVMVRLCFNFLEIMFRDGVPLNQHFMALKTKYNNEKEYFEKLTNVCDDLTPLGIENRGRSFGG
jgi:hypothetical protein